MICDEPRFLSGGDRAVFVEFGDAIDPEVNQSVIALKLDVEKARIPGIVESVPAYGSLLVYFEPLQISALNLQETIRHLHHSATVRGHRGRKLVKIPLVYGGDFGPDLEAVAKHNNLPAEEVIRVHYRTRYLVYMLGFMPGFPYLGSLSPEIATPRKTTPSLKIPAGSVGIAGNQTGIYPVESPGGWQIIARTPLKLFEPSWEPPALLQAGDYLKFVRITPEEYTAIEKRVRNGTCKTDSELIE